MIRPKHSVPVGRQHHFPNLQVIVALLVVLSLLSGCGNPASQTPTPPTQPPASTPAASLPGNSTEVADQNAVEPAVPTPTARVVDTPTATQPDTPTPEPPTATAVAVATVVPTSTPVPTPADIPAASTVDTATATVAPIPTAQPTIPATPTTGALAPAAAGPDLHLEAGFPVTLGRTYVAGPSLDILVGNINDDPELEIVTGYVDRSQLPGRVETLALRPDGSILTGWPVDRTFPGLGALGNLSVDSPGLELLAHQITQQNDVFELWFGMGALTGQGSLLAGWPQGKFPMYTYGLPMLADIDGDGLDEIFPNLSYRYSPLRADGLPVPGWQLDKTPASAVGDLDGDGRLEVITYWGSDFMSAYHNDGTLVPGFPIKRPADQSLNGHAPVVGDVDGDGSQEIVVVAGQYPPEPNQPPDVLGIFKQLVVDVFSANGTLEQVIPVPGKVDPASTLALGDLDCDGFPEIAVQTTNSLSIFKGDGTPFPGWTQKVWGDSWQGYSGPLIGDVDGDGLPDIVVLVATFGPERTEELRAYDRKGRMIAGFPKVLSMGKTASAAIADVDLDGRNEIIVRSSRSHTPISENDELWMFDLRGQGTYGPVPWGQFRGGPQHQGYYRPKELGCAR